MRNQKPITVAELIKALRQMEPDLIVVLSRDPEGNGFSVLRTAALDVYKDGQLGIEELTPALRKLGYTDEDVLKGGQKAVVLWPS
jgi:hypothetical protein